MFSSRRAVQFALSQLWPGLLAAVVVVIFIPNRVAALLGLAFVFAIASGIQLRRYGRAWEKHKELSAKFGSAYDEKFESWITRSGIDGYVRFGWAMIELELEKKPLD